MSLTKRSANSKASSGKKKLKRQQEEEEEQKANRNINKDLEDDDIVEEGDTYVPLDDNTTTISKPIKKKEDIPSIWEDPDDKEIRMNLSTVSRLRKLRKHHKETIVSGEEYQDRLKEYYNKTTKTSHFYDWVNKKADVEEATEESYLDSILKTNVSILEGSKTDVLPPEIIKISRVTNNPRESKHNCVIQAIDFHRNNETLLSSGLDKTIKIFNISKVFETNKYEMRPLKTLYATNLPILTAKFNSSRNEILATGLRKYLLIFDLVKETFDKSAPSFITSRLNGKIKSFKLSPDEETIALYGDNQYLMMADARTKQLKFELRLNSECSSCVFSPDNRYLFASTEDGNIYQWDLNMRKVVEMFHDVGSMKTTCMDFAGDSSYLASGTSSGIANLYRYNRLTRTLDKNIAKEITNLTTSLDDVHFNPTGEIMAISSRWKRNAIRLVHMPSQTVFSNWPNMKTKTSFIHRVAFSENSRYMALGNDVGNVIIYNLEHYE